MSMCSQKSASMQNGPSKFAKSLLKSWSKHRTLFGALEGFLDNADGGSRGGGGKAFDGRRFARAFQADQSQREPYFNGLPYIARFNWREVLDSECETHQTRAEALLRKAEQIQGGQN